MLQHWTLGAQVVSNSCSGYGMLETEDALWMLLKEMTALNMSDFTITKGTNQGPNEVFSGGKY